MKIATIGTSKIAHQLVEAFLACEGVVVEAVYSRQQATAQAFANQYHVKKTYTDLAKMLQDTEIELVYVASPNAVHYEQVQQILKAGKHVICEKPITLRSSEFESLCELAKKHNCFLFEAISTLHMPNYKYLKQELKRLNNVHLLTCDLSQYSNRYEQFKKGIQQNVFDVTMGGGALYDLGVYCLHFVLGLYGKPDSIYASQVLYNDVDTSGTIVLTYPNMNAILTYGKDSQGEAGIKIQSESGYWKVQGPCSRVSTLEWVENNLITDCTQPTKSQHHVHEIEDFLEIIKTNNHIEERNLWQTSLLVCQVIDEIHQKGIL